MRPDFRRVRARAPVAGTRRCEPLAGRTDGTLYRIELGALGPDPRIALRLRSSLSDDELATLRGNLAKLDASPTSRPWTRRVLQLIHDKPAVRAGDLCNELNMERLPFKANVRKLKALGLTESLEVGYRLSPRGAALLSFLGQLPAA